MCSNLRSHVQNTNAFSYALLWRVVYSSQFYCLTSRYFGALSILTGKAEATDFAVLVFNENAHFQWIWSDNFWSRDSAPPMAVGEKHRLYNNKLYFMNFKRYSSKYKYYALNCIHFLFEFKTLCFDIQRKIFEIQRLIFGNLTIISEILR